MPGFYQYKTTTPNISCRNKIYNKYLDLWFQQNIGAMPNMCSENSTKLMPADQDKRVMCPKVFATQLTLSVWTLEQRKTQYPHKI